MNAPLAIERYLKLITAKPLDKSTIKAWYQCVKDHAPSGIIRTITTKDDEGSSKTVSLVHQEGKRHCYVIPLTRDLSNNEIDEIIQGFSGLETDLSDFDVETNETRLMADDKPPISMDAAKHLQLCTALAKHKHEEWVRERTDAGWRYGTKFDPDEKTHPLLRPWDQIPDRFRQPDMDWPQKLVHMLNDQGYAVISKDDLKRLKRP